MTYLSIAAQVHRVHQDALNVFVATVAFGIVYTTQGFLRWAAGRCSL